VALPVRVLIKKRDPMLAHRKGAAAPQARLHEQLPQAVASEAAKHDQPHPQLQVCGQVPHHTLQPPHPGQRLQGHLQKQSLRAVRKGVLQHQPQRPQR